jgi:hypothetical protein
MLTLDAAKNLKAGQWIYSTISTDSKGNPHRVKVTSVKTWKTRPNEVLIGAKFGLRRYLKISEEQLDGWRL